MEKKIALVTGGSGGIGQAIVKELMADGFFVLFTYGRNEEEAAKLEVENSSKKLQFSANQDEEKVQKFVEKIINDYGQIDVLVNNLGKTNDKLVMKMTKEDFEDVLDVNLTTAFVLSKLVVKFMSKKKRGSIINMASIVGITGNLGQANYSASKAGLIALTKTMSKEYARKGIRINAIAPGFIKSPMTEKLGKDLIKNVENTISMKRLGEPEDVANIVSFLAGEKSGYMTGQTLVVDGGLI